MCSPWSPWWASQQQGHGYRMVPSVPHVTPGQIGGVYQQGASNSGPARPPPPKRPVPGAGAEQGKEKVLRPDASQTKPAAPISASALSDGQSLLTGVAAGGSDSRASQPVEAAATAVRSKTYTVYCDEAGNDEAVIRTLVGEFTEHSENHGRKVYKKTMQAGFADNMEVLLYYWDNRDTASFEGWWFGNEVGGTQVWSHCKSSSLEPPGRGWKIPWDGVVQPALRIASKEEVLKMEAGKELERLLAEVSEKEAQAREALEQAKAMAPADDNAESLNSIAEAAKLIVPKVTLITDLGRKVSGRTRTAVGEHGKTMKGLSKQLRDVHQALLAELKRIRRLHEKVEEQAEMKDLQDRDSDAFADILPQATVKANTAEDLVQTAVIISEMILDSAEDLEQARSAIAQTEQAAKKANVAICEARIYISAKLGTVEKFHTEKIKADAKGQLGRQQQQLKEAHDRLAPLKTVRVEFEQKRQADEVLEEASSKAALAEVDVDKAEAMILKLGDEDALDQGNIDLAKRALKTAKDHVDMAFRNLEARQKSSTGFVLAELNKIAPRGDEAKSRLKRLEDSVKEALERSKTTVVIGEASQKVVAVTAALIKLDEIEAQLQVDEDTSLQDLLAVVAEADNVTTGAQSSISSARMFIQMKALEVKRLTGSAGQEAVQQLKDFTREVESASKRLVEIKASIVRQKRLALLRDARNEVASVEERLEQVKQAASIFADEVQLMLLSADEIREASEKTAAEEKATSEMISEVRKTIMTKQIEAKGKDASPEVSAELTKLQSRLSMAQTELGKQRKLLTSVEQQLASKRLLEEVEEKLRDMEDKVAKATSSMANVGSCEVGALQGEKRPKDSEPSLADATLTVRNMTRYLESQMRTHQGFAREALSKLEPRVKQAQDRLDSAALSMRANSERQLVRNVLDECHSKVAECEERLQEAADAETTALDGLEGHDFEKAIQVASNAATNAKVLLKMKCLSVKRLSEATAKSTGETLVNLQGTVDDASKKLVQMRSRFNDWKKDQLRKASPGAK